MTTRFRLATVLGTFFLFALPTLADAGLIEWIDQWSGPGPFWGASMDWRIVCASKEEKNAIQQEGTPRYGPGKALIGIIGPGCFFNPVEGGRKRTASLNLAVGFYDDKRNDLPYEPGVDTDVKLTTLEPSIWIRLAKGVEVGTGFGVMWVTGPAFESFHRVYIRPLQVDVKPLFLLDPGAKYGSLYELISLRAGWLVVPSGFAAKDFGASPGYRSGREFVKTVALYLDLEPVMRRIAGEK